MLGGASAFRPRDVALALDLLRILEFLRRVGVIELLLQENFAFRELALVNPVDFRESGWDVKRLMKTIVMSATYQQSSVISEKLAEQDPENILLARAPRFRLRFPSPEYEDEFGACRRYLEEEVTVDRATLDAVAAGVRTEPVLELLRRRVVLEMPERYF